MKRTSKRILCILAGLLILVGCQSIRPVMAETAAKVNATIGGTTFKAEIYDNSTGKAFLAKLPEEFRMSNTDGTEEPAAGTEEPMQNKELTIRIGETKVNVDWEDNESVAGLKDFVKGSPLSIPMSMYGGFEQVGSLGTSLPRKDAQTTTASGDIVLYQGNQIVIFYGSNSWSYTRLGHITDQDSEGMAELLGSKDVTVTISME